MMFLQDVGAGFSAPVFAAQTVFRRVLDAMAHPGRIVTLPSDADAPPGLGATTTAIALTLLDFETKVWLDPAIRGAEAERYLRFHCGCSVVDETLDAGFAIIAKPRDMPRLGRFSIGQDQYPDTSATLIVEVDALANAGDLRLTGPGIKQQARINLDGLPAWFWEDWATNHACFPTGVDVIFTCADRAMCLPRSIKVEAKQCMSR